ncbi:glycosyltransferase family 8 protein [Methylobacterium sp. J-076]|uniref:glycosyltransferase family 8 protein n=1 Tax=Methylobacterium sp. J-076 TaxID=2836655 RepID=UPI001FBBEB4D|nr:glycosyltransferase [Methylobacterium sp. J-076]MCJ2012610.1 hypothetical protein [Methylobacterium sp. J-076]
MAGGPSADTAASSDMGRRGGRGAVSWSTWKEEGGGMSASCWCYTVNQNYLLPALVSALQLRAYTDRRGDRIVVVLIDDEGEVSREAAEAMRPCGIEIVVVPPSLMMGYPLYCARLFLCQIIDCSRFDFINYIDADTQFVGEVAAFADANPRPGSILAVPDIMSIVIDHPSKSFQAHGTYFTQLGIPEHHQRIYFNTGVMKFRPSDWGAISKECLAFLRRHGLADLRYPDQDALNIVMDGGQTLASFRWNFPAFFIGCGFEGVVEPSILHFMSRPRPWDGPFPPWGAAAHQPYLRFVERFPQLQNLFAPSRNVRMMRYMLQQLFKVKTEPWGTAFIRERVAAFEARAFV